ncbi:MAG: type II toxin-antitoxin system VapC family toxin [Deltaproteobacteria bacterium]|nr:type II toxin-antitoxin system VapC family toxin [Deltaproteobacteria bacterium]
MLLDTCVVSELARPAPDPRVLAWLDSVDDSELRLSVLTLGEIKKGADLLEEGPRKVRVEAWLDEMRTTFADRVLPVDEAVALRWGAISAASRRAGRVRPPIDSLLAATAVCHQLKLATRNVADFEGTGAVIVNPWEATVR